MIGNIIKYLIVYRLLTSPQAETAILCLCILLCLFFGAFVKLKNGWLSWICYFVLLGIPISLLTINIVNVNLTPEDLQLSSIKTDSYIRTDNDGVVVKRLLRREVTLPLLGIREVTDERRLDDLTTFIESHIQDKVVYYQTSKKYEGIILLDNSGNDLNIELISKGYVKVTDKAPSQYLIAANDARERGVGVWAGIVGIKPDTMKEYTIYISLFMLGYIFMEEYKRFKKSSIFIRLKYSSWEKIYEEIKSNCWPRKDNKRNNGGRTTKSGGTNGRGDSNRGDSDGGGDSTGGAGKGT